jgi:hypothetical protein
MTTNDSLGIKRDAAMALLGIKKYAFGAWIRRKRAQGIEIKVEGMALYRRDLLLEAFYSSSKAAPPKRKLTALQKMEAKENGNQAALRNGAKAKKRR